MLTSKDKKIHIMQLTNRTLRKLRPQKLNPINKKQIKEIRHKLKSTKKLKRKI